MSHRVYIVLDIIVGKSSQITQALQSKPGVILADELEDQSKAIIVVQAADRQKLAEFAIQAIESVESVTEGIQFLIAKNE